MAAEPKIDEERERLALELFEVRNTIRYSRHTSGMELRKREIEAALTALDADEKSREPESDEWRDLELGEVMQEGDVSIRIGGMADIAYEWEWHGLPLSQVGQRLGSSLWRVRRRKPIDASYEKVLDYDVPYMLKKAKDVAKTLPDEKRAGFQRDVAVLKADFTTKLAAMIDGVRYGELE